MKKMLKKIIIVTYILLMIFTAIVIIPIFFGTNQENKDNSRYIMAENTQIHGIPVPKNSQLDYESIILSHKNPNTIQNNSVTVLNTKEIVSKIQFPQAQKWGDFMINEIEMERDLADNYQGIRVVPVELKKSIKTNDYKCALNSPIYFAPKNPPTNPDERDWQAQNYVPIGCEIANQVHIKIAEKPLIIKNISIFEKNITPDDDEEDETENHIETKPTLPTKISNQKHVFHIKSLKNNKLNFELQWATFDEHFNLLAFSGTINQNTKIGNCDYFVNETISVKMHHKNESSWTSYTANGKHKTCAEMSANSDDVFELFEKYVQ